MQTHVFRFWRNNLHLLIAIPFPTLATNGLLEVLMFTYKRTQLGIHDAHARSDLTFTP